MAVLIKKTLDGRRVEVIGQAICLDGKLEAIDLMEVKAHPNRHAIRRVAPDATHMAGRVTLTAEEAAIVQQALKDAEAQMLANPIAITERFRIAALQKARQEGIE